MLGALQFIGNKVNAWLSFVGSVVMLGVESLRWLTRTWPDRKVLLWQFYFVGVGSVQVIIFTGAFTGMVLAYQSYFQFLKLGVTSWIGPLLAVSLVTQLGPVLAGLMLAGRVGCAIAAEIGTMAVTEQVDALETMGTDPVNYLVVPRVVACTVLTPILSALATFIGIAAGFSLAIFVLGVESHYMFKQTYSFLNWYDFFEEMVKAAVFGCSIALICCYHGITTRGGAEGVGKSTTEANVASCIAILMLNLFLTMVLMMFDPFQV